MRTLCTFCNNISEKDTKWLKCLQFAFLPVSVRKMVDKWQTQYYNKCINAFGWIECRISKLRQMRRLPFGLPFFAWIWKRSGRPLRFFVFAQMILHPENNFETDALVQVFLSHFRKNTENWAENLSSQAYTHVFSANYARKSTGVSYEDRF